MQLEHLVIYDKNYIHQHINFRTGETKLGERISMCSNALKWQEELNSSSSTFVLVGLPEDIGVQGNLGRKGAQSAWEVALLAILNIQNNRFLEGSDIFLLGHLNFQPLVEEVDAILPESVKRIDLIREKVALIDQWVSHLIQVIVQAGKIPIVIGGGHNNALGCLKGAALAKGKAVNAINLDPHADYRALEGRHSGNGFSYAKEAGHLEKYCVIGAHEGYNSEQMLQQFDQDKNLKFITFEELFIRKEKELGEFLKSISGEWSQDYTGIEIDLDCIADIPVSAYSPSGFLIEDVRRFMHFCGTHFKPAYIHICEGAPALGDLDAKTKVGKTIAYLITDFVKAIKSKS